MRSGQRGQAGAEFALLVSFLFLLGLVTFQFAGLALTQMKVAHAAQEAAYVAASSPEGAREAATYQTVVQNLGDLPADNAIVRVTPAAPGSSVFRVSVTYRQPVSSPLLRMVVGPTFTATGEASSWTA